jgi:hypothetical protein
MNWKKSLFLGALVGMAVFAMVGCGTAEVKTSAAEPVPTATQPAPAATRPTPLSDTSTNGTMPLPPGGVIPNDNRTPAPAMDLATAAAKLGVTETQLREALGEFQGLPDMAAAAAKLGVAEDSLREALGVSVNGTFPGGPPPGGTPPAGPGPTGQGQ